MASTGTKDFWTTDLEKIESTFLPKGEKIFDLRCYRHSNVPSQGTVLTEVAVYKGKEPGFACVFLHRFGKLFSSFSK